MSTSGARLTSDLTLAADRPARVIDVVSQRFGIFRSLEEEAEAFFPRSLVRALEVDLRMMACELHVR